MLIYTDARAPKFGAIMKNALKAEGLTYKQHSPKDLHEATMTSPPNNLLAATGAKLVLRFGGSRRGIFQMVRR